MTDLSVVLCTVPSEDVGVAIARAVVEGSLAACVNIVPGVRSIYRYQGKVEDDRELLLVIKTRTDKIAALEVAIRALHPYEVPEVIALDITTGAAPYLAWVREQTA